MGMKFEVAMEGRSYNFVHCKIGVEGKSKTKKFRTKQLAFDDALDTLVDKMHEKWTIVEASENEESESSEPSPPPKKKTTRRKNKKRNESESDDESGDVFSGYTFSISGKKQKEKRDRIEDHGGKWKSQPSKMVDFLV